MIVKLFAKNGGVAKEQGFTGPIILDAESVVEMPFGPENVARFDKHGQDLVLALHDGTRIVILDFFEAFSDAGRNDLVFTDAAGVTWWAQYEEPWQFFDIVQITREAVAILLLPGTASLGGLLTAVGLAGPAAGRGPLFSTIPLGPNAEDVAELEVGGAVIPITALTRLATAPIGPITTTYGTITLTGFKPERGDLTFRYDLEPKTGDRVDPGSDIVEDIVAISVTNTDGDVRNTSLRVAVRDGVPTVDLDPAFTGEILITDDDLGTDGTGALGDAFDSALGTDGGMARYERSVEDQASDVVDAVSDDPVVLTLEGREVVGRVAGSDEIVFTIPADPATGAVMADQQRLLEHGEDHFVKVAAGSV